MTVENTKTTQQLLQEESNRAIEEFLANGGKIQYIETGKRTDPQDIKSAWGRRPKAVTTEHTKTKTASKTKKSAKLDT